MRKSLLFTWQRQDLGERAEWCGYIGRVHYAICNVHRQEKKGGEGSYVRVRWDTSKARARTLQTLRPAHGTDTAGRVLV